MIGERLELRPEYRALAREIAALLVADWDLHPRSRTVIGIAGESGSGKSVTAAGLAAELEEQGFRAGVLHQDNYFLLPPRTNHLNRCRDLANVGPHEVNLALMGAHITAFRSGRDVEDAPRVDYAANRFDPQRLPLASLRVLVVEGTYVLGLPGLDVRIFLEATHADTQERRLARNRDANEPIIDQILDIEHRIIAAQADRADLVIDRDFRVRPR